MLANVPEPRVLLNRSWAQSDIRGGPSLLDRLWAKVEIGAPDECWPFTGAQADGYGRIGLGGVAAGSGMAHRVVADAYLPPPRPGDVQVRHLCGNRSCCNPEHLARGDQAANELDKISHGRSNRGTRHGMSKLTEEQIREVRFRLNHGWSQRSLAEKYGVAQQTISEIATGRTWAWFA